MIISKTRRPTTSAISSPNGRKPSLKPAREPKETQQNHRTTANGHEWTRIRSRRYMDSFFRLSFYSVVSLIWWALCLSEVHFFPYSFAFIRSLSRRRLGGGGSIRG